MTAIQELGVSAGAVAGAVEAASSAAAGGAPGAPGEVPGYLTLGREQLYYVLHGPAGRARGQVLLAGPFTYERPHCYIAWVRWARCLAQRGYEVVRFDYRGQGESTGAFADYTFTAWVEDLRAAAAWLAARGGGAPLVLHGLGIGALVAARAFQAGLGAGLLLWDAPASGRELLYDGLRLALVRYCAMGGDGPPQNREELIARLEAGQSVEVDGYEWSPRLWREGKEFVLGLPLDPPGAPGSAEASEVAGAGDRPWTIMAMDALSAYVFVGASRRYVANPWRRRGLLPLLPDLAPFFGRNLRWLDETCPIRAGGRP